MKSFGRKQSGGGFRREQRSERTLRQRIEEFHNFKALDTDQLVENLRSIFPEYARTKMQPFTRQVENAVNRMNHAAQPLNPKKSNDGDQPPAFEFEDEDETKTTPNQSPAYKRVKRTDKSEERLRRIEAQHVVRRQRKGGNDPDRPSTSSSLSDSSASDATSDDDVYGEEMEVKYDLIKSNLRTTYSGSKPKAKSKSKGIQEEEVEVVNNRVAKKVGMSGRRDRIESSRLNNEISNGDDDEKGNEGPRFKDLGGLNGVVDELKMEVIVPLYHPQLPKWLGVKPMAGILLHGPPGCGKTKLAHAIANETGVPFYKISATELVTGVSGASEENIRDLFSKAHRTAPSIVFIDEIDAIASKRENLQREMERRIVTQLMTCMDELHRLSKPASLESSENPDAAATARPGYVLVIGATNRPDAVDSALRRPGRFDREFVLGVPDEKSRVEILTVLTRNLKLEGDFDLLKIARATPGFVGADLAAVANKAGNLAMKRIIDQRKSEFCKEDNKNEGEDSEDWWRKSWSVEEMEKLSITMVDFEEAAKMVQPSSRREGFSAIPNVKWEDVGGLDLLRQEFDRYIVRRIKYPEDYEEFGVDLETGFLLYGPPGCGKTLIAKAVANEAGANFIHIKGPELLNKYVGESELAVRTIFSRARTCAPCILFFDEVDALTTKRGKEGGWVVERLLNQLLIELDGADQRRGVYVIGATNRPEVMDRAVLRPGRFGKLLYVPLPSPEERGLILKALSRKKPIDSNVDLISIGRNESCKNLSGADLSALMNEAAMAALDEKLRLVQTSSEGAPLTIKESHFEYALTKISPSVSDKQKQYYGLLSDSFKAI